VAVIRKVLARISGLGQSPASRESLHQELAGSVVKDLSGRLGRACDLIDFRATRTGSLTIRIGADRPYIAKLPLRASTEPRLRQNAQSLHALSQKKWATPFLLARLPAPVCVGMASGYFYSVETTVPGQDGASILRSGGSPDELILSAERFLSKLQKASADAARAEHSSWEAPFEAAGKRVETLARRAGGARSYTRLFCAVTNQLSRQPVRSVYSHGNFWLGNALFDGASNLTGVIDWDCADECSLPALDMIYLLVRTHSTARSASFGEALADWIDAESLPFLDHCMARHCLELSIPADLVRTLSYCSWIQHLDAHCRFGTATRTNPEWLQRNVRHVLDRCQPDTVENREAYRWHTVG